MVAKMLWFVRFSVCHKQSLRKKDDLDDRRGRFRYRALDKSGEAEFMGAGSCCGGGSD